jgi:hypothetical protein
MIQVLRVLKIPTAIVMVLLAGVVLEAADSTEKSPEMRLKAAATMGADAVSRYTPMEIYGVQVFIDQETGLIRTPSPEEAAALSAELRSRYAVRAPQTKSLAAPVVHANGTVSMELDPSLLNFSVVQIKPDGEVKFECTKGHVHASELVEASHAGPEKE